MAANGDPFWGPLLLLNNRAYFSSNDTEAKELFNGFSEEAKNSFYGQALKKQIFPKTLKGKSVPEFSLPDRNEKVYSMKELSKGKKCVLIDFWASWCGPCRKSIPFLKKMYQDLVDQGLEIISISIDKSNADWLKALDEEQLPWPCLIDTENVFAEKFDGRAIPMFILVDENGIVVEDNLRDQALKNKIEELIRNK